MKDWGGRKKKKTIMKLGVGGLGHHNIINNLSNSPISIGLLGGLYTQDEG